MSDGTRPPTHERDHHHGNGHAHDLDHAQHHADGDDHDHHHDDGRSDKGHGRAENRGETEGRAHAAGHDHGGHHHGHVHDHHHTEGHVHDHGDHDHGHHHREAHGHHDHDHTHPHPHGGVKGFLYDLFVPHTHDAADSIDDALEASAAGIRALKISLLILLATTVLQAVVVAFTGSIALLADTIHNFADALTAVPLWIAFVLGRRVANRRYTYGYGRAEDLAGMFIVFVVALSAIVAGWQAIDRFITPRPIEFPWLLVAAGLIGFAGNEAVAIYRIRVGRRIGSAALVADGVHARLDGFTSLSVVLGAVGVLLGFPLADPIIGLLISMSIMVLLWGTVRSIGARLMDAIDPALVARAEQALAQTPGVEVVRNVRLRWVGHRLTGSAVVEVDAPDLHAAEQVADHASAHVHEAIGNVDDFTVTPTTHVRA